MNRFIFGFQRRVWCPKWTPASRRSFMETTGICAPFSVLTALRRRRLDGDRLGGRPPSTSRSRRIEGPDGAWYRHPLSLLLGGPSSSAVPAPRRSQLLRDPAPQPSVLRWAASSGGS